MFLFMYSLLITASSLTTLMLTPMHLGLTILMMALSTSIMFALMNSSWMAFLLFLIYVSGMLVMFAYFIAISPNMETNFTKPMFLIIPTLLMFMMMSTTMYSINTNFISNTNTFYSLSNGSTLIMLALTLLLTMIIVVKITSSNKGPLRPFNYV